MRICICSWICWALQRDLSPSSGCCCYHLVTYPHLRMLWVLHEEQHGALLSFSVTYFWTPWVLNGDLSSMLAPAGTSWKLLPFLMLWVLCGDLHENVMFSSGWCRYCKGTWHPPPVCFGYCLGFYCLLLATKFTAC